MYKYQNVSKEEQTITTSEGRITPRVVKPGDTVLSSVALENPNFKYLGEDQSDTPNVTGTQMIQSNQVSEAHRLNIETKKENN